MGRRTSWCEAQSPPRQTRRLPTSLGYDSSRDRNAVYGHLTRVPLGPSIRPEGGSHIGLTSQPPQPINGGETERSTYIPTYRGGGVLTAELSSFCCCLSRLFWYAAKPLIPSDSHGF